MTAHIPSNEFLAHFQFIKNELVSLFVCLSLCHVYIVPRSVARVGIISILRAWSLCTFVRFGLCLDAFVRSEVVNGKVSCAFV